MTSPRSQAGYAPVNGLEMYYEIHHHRHEAPQAAVSYGLGWIFPGIMPKRSRAQTVSRSPPPS